MIAVYNILWCHSLALGLDGDGYTVFVAAAYHHHLFTVKAQKPCVNIGGHIHPGQMSYMNRTVGIGKSRGHQSPFEFLLHNQS